MTIDEQKRLRALCDGATSGPWLAGRMDGVSYDGDGAGPYKNVYTDDERGGVHMGERLPYTVARGEGDKDECRANAAFIAAARTAVPELLDALATAEERAATAERERDAATRRSDAAMRVVAAARVHRRVHGNCDLCGAISGYEDAAARGAKEGA